MRGVRRSVLRTLWPLLVVALALTGCRQDCVPCRALQQQVPQMLEMRLCFSEVLEVEEGEAEVCAPIELRFVVQP
jgi:hypothetical protein